MAALVRICAEKMGSFQNQLDMGTAGPYFPHPRCKGGQGSGGCPTLMETLQANPWAAGKGRGRQNIQPQAEGHWRNTVWLGSGGGPEGLCYS